MSYHFKEEDIRIILRAMQFNQETVEKEYGNTGMSKDFLAVKSIIQKEVAAQKGICYNTDGLCDEERCYCK